MDQNLTDSIESFLLTEPGNDGWFREVQICERFGIEDDRFLRAVGSTPGPLSRCTIFSVKGVKHIRRATAEEIQKCKERIDNELRSRVRRRRWLKEGLARVLDGDFEKHTGQKIITE